MITFKVTDRNDRVRLYEFDQDELRIGARSGVDIALDSGCKAAGELRVSRNAEGYFIEPLPGCSGFTLNGSQVEKAAPLREGAVLGCAGYRISVPRLVWAARPPATEDAAAPKAPAAPRAAPQADASYLVLFFQPVREFLEDDDVSEVLINGPSQIYIERKGKLIPTPARFQNEQALQAAVRNVARNIGRRFDEEQPRLDARLPDGSRVHGVLPPLARGGTVVAIRKFRRDRLTMDQLVTYGSISRAGADLIQAIVRLHKNIIVSGPTSSGKTSVLNVLSASIPNDERILVIEDATELQLQQTHVVQFETRKPDEHGKGEVTIRDLVHSSLRLRPDRLVVGEIRGAEALDLLQALNTGHSGSMSTIHANGPKDALARIETCALLSGIEIPLYALRDQVRTAVNVVIHTARLTDGTRKITHVSEVLGVQDGEYVVQDLVRYRVDRMESDGRLIGRHVGTGVPPTFMDEARLRGMPLDPAVFAAPAD